VRFHVNRAVFLGRIPGHDETIVLGPDKVFELVSRMLGKAREKLKDLPIQELRPSRVQQIVEELQVVGAINDPSESELTDQSLA